MWELWNVLVDTVFAKESGLYWRHTLKQFYHWPFRLDFKEKWLILHCVYNWLYFFYTYSTSDPMEVVENIFMVNYTNNQFQPFSQIPIV